MLGKGREGGMPEGGMGGWRKGRGVMPRWKKVMFVIIKIKMETRGERGGRGGCREGVEGCGKNGGGVKKDEKYNCV